MLTLSVSVRRIKKTRKSNFIIFRLKRIFIGRSLEYGRRQQSEYYNCCSDHTSYRWRVFWIFLLREKRQWASDRDAGRGRPWAFFDGNKGAFEHFRTDRA